MGIRIGGQIDRVSGKELSYREFVERYMEKNEPVVITGLMDEWRACRDWVTEEGNPDLHFFSTHFGKSKVQVSPHLVLNFCVSNCQLLPRSVVLRLLFMAVSVLVHESSFIVWLNEPKLELE